MIASQFGYCTEPNTCVCEPGYGGSLCNNDADVCGHQSPCNNGATCENTGLDAYQCLCAPGYTGTNCETEINECATNPCQNGATCFVSKKEIYTFPSTLNRIKSMIMYASASKDTRVTTVRPISTSAPPILAKMEEHALYVQSIVLAYAS